MSFTASLVLSRSGFRNGVCQPCHQFRQMHSSRRVEPLTKRLNTRRSSSGSGNGSRGRRRTFLGWKPIPTSVGLACIAVLAFRQSWRRNQRDRERADEAATIYNGIEVTDRQVRFALLLPTRIGSRGWGWLSEVYLPVWMRRPVLGLVIWATGMKMEEAVRSDVKGYSSLLDLFTRDINLNQRPISKDAALVSPCDGQVVHVAEVDCHGKVEQVKGVSYPVRALFGPDLLPDWVPDATTSDPGTGENAGNQSGTLSQAATSNSTQSRADGPRLLQCIIYLSPADYHQYHSPAEWNIMHRRHFAGALLPVKLSMWSWVRGLMPLNERVVLTGAWQHGFFSYTTVGAYNVGSMRFTFDKDLKTNYGGVVRGFYRDEPVKVDVAPGSRLGEFRFGSTIALVFEAPADFKFSVKAGDQVRVGSAIGQCS